MSTFTIPDTQVSVQLCDDLTKDQLLEFPAFKGWLSRLQSNLSLQHKYTAHEFHSSPYALRSLKIQAIDRFGASRLGFVKFTASITNNEGESLPGAVFLRGPSVGMLVVLQPDDLPSGSQEEKHVLLTVQPRVAAGSLQFVELPAGMVDDGTFKGSAAQEIKEEIGLDIPEDELINLTELAIPTTEGEDTPKAVFPSAGGCDECIPLFLHEKRVPRETLKEWTG
ncbi:Nudix hydrolase 14-like chloroplastic protein, partial [Lachnellula suecica]